ncbi:MAG: DHHA1 domain-containing protein [Nanobdellota archaeon]
MKRYCYHHNDEDGFASAGILLHVYGEVELQSCSNIEHPQLVTGYDEVYVVDYSFSQEQFVYLQKNNKKLIWIDHHKSTIDSITIPIEGLQDSSRSACVLTWKYMFGDDPLPLVLEHINDEDLWLWKKDYSNEFMLYLKTKLSTDNQPAQLKHIIETYAQKDYENAYTIGSYLLEYRNTLLKKTVKRGVIRNLFGYKTMVFFATNLISHLGNKVLEQYPDVDVVAMITIVTTSKGNICYKYSLRSRKDTVDVSVIAQQYGGGGHSSAAGFTSDSLLL